MEKNIEKNPFCSAMAGTKTLHYIDVKNITSMIPKNDGWNVSLRSGHDWKRIHFSKCKTGTSTDGETYKHTAEATIPAKGNMSVRDIMVLERGRYVIKITDNNGIQWLMGDTTAPMRMSVTDTNGGSPNEETGYLIVFSGVSAWPQMRIE